MTDPVRATILGVPLRRPTRSVKTQPAGAPAPDFLEFFVSPMSEYRPQVSPEPVHLTVHSLPRDVADQIRDVQSREPELLTKILLYGMVHREVFETLSQSWGG